MSLYQVFMSGNASEECHCSVLANVATVVLHAVADDEVWYLQHYVVAGNLVKGLLAELYVRGLELHDDERLAMDIVEYGIGTALLPVLLQADFVSHAGQGVAKRLHHPMCEVLAHPFLRREHNPA